MFNRAMCASSMAESLSSPFILTSRVLHYLNLRGFRHVYAKI